MNKMTFALVGNQNCGKTTLFNRLTGSNQHVGNFPGVTVEKKQGQVRGVPFAQVVDLPGIYSLSPYTTDEIVTRDFLIQERPDAIINIVDATNIERNLYLSLQLLELNRPMVIALNMMDEVTKSGNSVDAIRLSKKLGIPVVPISAAKNEGMSDLILALKTVAEQQTPPPKFDFCTGPVHRAMHAIAHIIEEKAEAQHMATRYAATKLIEFDKSMAHTLALTQNEQQIVHQIVREMEFDLGTDHDAAMADMRYQYIEKLTQSCVKKHFETNEQVRSEKIDRILTHKHFGIPIFFSILFLIFALTFGVVGPVLQDGTEYLVGSATSGIIHLLESLNMSPWLLSLLQDGVFAGVGSVLSFLPLIILLFLFLSILEDSGYMARVAFVMDQLLRKIGLSGRSFVPMLLGFGCSVPAIMSTRTLSSQRDRKITIVLIPFMSCSAKLPIYGVITAAFFPSRGFAAGEIHSIGDFFSSLVGVSQGALVMLSLYILGIFVAVLSGLLLQKTIFHGNATPFVMELPAYRFPSVRNVLLQLWERAKDFLRRAFTIIFAASIVLWFLQNFDTTLSWAESQSNSILATVGAFISPLFAPLGFADFRLTTALFTGVIAKEMVVSTLSVLTGSSTPQDLTMALQGVLSPMSAYAFLVFTILYMPCVAAFAATKRELGSLRNAIFVALYQTGVAYLVALFIFQCGSATLRLLS